MANVKVVYHDGTKSIQYPNGTIKKGGHRNWRNNNPGNIRKGSFTQSHGAIGDDGSFAVFNSMDDGYQAQADLLQTGNYQNKSLEGAIYRYAPPSENDSAGYVNYVASKTGIDPNKKMSDMTDAEMDSIVRAMSDHEGMKNGTGDVIDGATVNGNQATGGTKTDDPFDEGGGEPGNYSSNDPCNPAYYKTPSATNQVAQVEGNGTYTQDKDPIDTSPFGVTVYVYTGPSGRYSITQRTAIGSMIAMGWISSNQEGEELWQLCRKSATKYCREVQDGIASQQVAKMGIALNGDRNKFRNLYLRWKIGVTSSDKILDADKGSGQITDSNRIALMDDQEWTKNKPCHGDTTKFLNQMDDYIKQQGVDPYANV